MVSTVADSFTAAPGCLQVMEVGPCIFIQLGGDSFAPAGTQTPSSPLPPSPCNCETHWPGDVVLAAAQPVYTLVPPS